MKYSTNTIYDYVVKKIKLSYPNIYCTSTYQPTIEKVPAVFIQETNAYEPIENITLAFDSDQYQSTFEVQIFSETLTELDDITSTVKSAFHNLYFRLIYCNRVPNRDYKIKRVVARFERIVCGADDMPNY